MNPVALAISGSLRKPSFTEKMLDLCIEGMGPNLEVHRFYPHKMNIGPCNSCYACWSKKTPGRCAQQDDSSTKNTNRSNKPAANSSQAASPPKPHKPSPPPSCPTTTTDDSPPSPSKAAS